MTRAKPEPTAERIEELRALLREGTRRQKLDAMSEAAIAGAVAASLVPDIAPFLTSEDYVPVGERDYSFSGHAPLASEAMGAIEAIGTAPDLATLRRLLEDPRIFLLPEASYDQGAYIGDYSSEEIAPAALAARLVGVMGTGGFALLPDLARNARHDEKLIWDSAIRAIERLARLVPDATPEDRAALAATAAKLGALPEAVAPASWRGFALRDLALSCRKKLDAA